MANEGLIQVALDKDLVQKLLQGLHNGAKHKALKVVISAAGYYQVESKELRMIIEVDNDNMSMKSLRISNEKQYAVVSRQDMEQMNLSSLAKSVIQELRDKYSPVFHSLADNIIVFNRAYSDENS